MAEESQSQLQFAEVDDDALFQPVAEQARFWEPDKYVFIARSIRRVINTNPKFKGNQNYWTFDVYNADGSFAKRTEDGTPATFSQFISDKMTPQSRARPLAEAIMGRKLSDGEGISGKALLGRPFVGFIQYEVPQNSTEGKEKPYLRSPMPFPKGRAFIPDQKEDEEEPIQQPSRGRSRNEIDELPF